MLRAALAVLTIGIAAAEPADLLRVIFAAQLEPAAREQLADAAPDRIAARLDAAHKAAARAALLAREKDAAEAELKTIAQGYSLLGFHKDEWRVAQTLKKRRPDLPDGYVVAASAYRDAGDLKRASAEARNALRLDPNDQAAKAVLALTEGRGTGSESSRAVPAAAPATAGAPRAALLRLSETPRRRIAGDVPQEGYLLGSPDEKPGRVQALRLARAYLSLNYHRPTAREREALAAVRKTLSSTESGRRLIDSMGGWERVDALTLIKFGTMPRPTYAAYTHVLSGLDRKPAGKLYAIILDESRLGEGPAALATTFQHELAHVRDYIRGQNSPGLQIASEYGAHLQQVYVYEDLKRSLSPADLDRLRNSAIWKSVVFLGRLWEDRITQRFSRNQFEGLFDTDRGRKVAREVYSDLAMQKVEPGTPQLRFHLYEDPVSGLYRVRTRERDLADIPGHFPHTARLRQQMLDSQADEDRLYRERHGFRIE